MLLLWISRSVACKISFAATRESMTRLVCKSGVSANSCVKKIMRYKSTTWKARRAMSNNRWRKRRRARTSAKSTRCGERCNLRTKKRRNARFCSWWRPRRSEAPEARKRRVEKVAKRKEKSELPAWYLPAVDWVRRLAWLMRTERVCAR